MDSHFYMIRKYYIWKIIQRISDVVSFLMDFHFYGNKNKSIGVQNPSKRKQGLNLFIDSTFCKKYIQLLCSKLEIKNELVLLTFYFLQCSKYKFKTRRFISTFCMIFTVLATTSNTASTQD